MKRENQAKKLAKQLQEVRDKKIRRLKAEVSEGRYQIKNAQVAKNLFISEGS